MAKGALEAGKRLGEQRAAKIRRVCEGKVVSNPAGWLQWRAERKPDGSEAEAIAAPDGGAAAPSGEGHVLSIAVR